jgi:hypothetical protein
MLPLGLFNLGDFCCEYRPRPTESEGVAHLSGCWGTGIVVRMVNPFHVERSAASVTDESPSRPRPQF